MTNRRKAIVVHSPHAGKAAQLQQGIAHLHENSVEIVDVLSIAALDGLSAQGPQWQEQDIDIVVATIWRIRQRFFLEHGLSDAINRRPQPERPEKWKRERKKRI